MSTIRIHAPFDGWCDALDAVPDPVFAGRMLGDGLAIDPTGAVVLAPCAGEIVTLPASAHAVSIRAADGVDVLVHVGIDTVTLNGRGFEARVRPGASVRAGDELIRFDLDVVARGAKSLMTPVLVTPMEGLNLVRRHTVGPVAAGDLLFEIEGIPDIAASTQPSGAAAPPSGAPVVQTLIVLLRQGLHARPAAILAQRAKAFGAAATLRAHGRSANARSVVAIMALGVRQGDELTIEANGTDAAQSVAGMLAGMQEAQRLESAAGHDRARAGNAAAHDVAARDAAAPTPLPGVLYGVAAV